MGSARVGEAEEFTRRVRQRLAPPTDSSEAHPPVGLVRTVGRNTCYANAVCQSLFCAPRMGLYLRSAGQASHSALCPRKRDASLDCCCICELGSLANDVHVAASAPNAADGRHPLEFLASCGRAGSHAGRPVDGSSHALLDYATNTQQDAGDFLLHLLEYMCASDADDPRSISRAFRGTLQSQLRCESCGRESNRDEDFYCLCLPIRKPSGDLVRTLDDAAGHFLREEVGIEYRCEGPHCSARGGDGPHARQYGMLVRPAILVVRLKRFEPARKLDHAVGFPLVWEASLASPARYALFAVVVHHGESSASGHYTCFVRRADGLWWQLDDARRSCVGERDVLDSRAYLLFYSQDERLLDAPRPSADEAARENARLPENATRRRGGAGGGGGGGGDGAGGQRGQTGRGGGRGGRGGDRGGGSAGGEMGGVDALLEHAGLIRYCCDRLGGAVVRSDAIDEGPTEATRRLLPLLCRQSAPSKAAWGSPLGLQLESQPHDASESAADEASKWSRVANALREMEQAGLVPDEVLDAVETIPGWIWGVGYMCRCDSCLRFTSAPGKRYTYLYQEKLVRKLPWYVTDADGTAAQALRDESFSVFERDELLDVARDHWAAFFGRLQDLVGRMPRLEGEQVTHDDMRSVLSETGGDAEAIAAAKAALLQQESHPRAGYLNQRAYATLALLNDLRRFPESTRALPPQLAEVRDPPFSRDFMLNFEGTEDDHYCLGSRRRGEKWYVGVSDDEARRHRQHAGEEARAGHKDRGAYFIRAMCGRTGSPPDPFGGWEVRTRPARPHEAFHVEIDAGPYLPLEEEARTLDLCLKHGVHHVRGGSFVLPTLDASELESLRRFYRGILGLCKRCGGKHMVSACPVDGQRADDDEALEAFGALRWQADDDRPDPFGRAQAVVESLVDVACVKRLVGVSNSAAADGEGTQLHRRIAEYVDALYPGRTLRPLQRRALELVVHADRPDITLTVPTAYGKTLVYLVAAAHEVISGDGSAVIFLPFSALMSDVAFGVASICAAQQRGAAARMHDSGDDCVATYEADERVRGTSMPYGGCFWIGERQVTWTIWRGQTGDEHMSQHMQTPVFHNADIIFATPDKWAHPTSSQHWCDSFVSTFGSDPESRQRWVGALRLVVVDEAHEFRDVLGGNMRQLIRRMEELRSLLAPDADRLRVMLVSATIPGPEGFGRSLLHERQPVVVQEPRDGAAEDPFRFAPAEGVPPAEDGLAPADTRAMLSALREQPEHRHRVLALLEGELSPSALCMQILQPEVLQPDVRRVLVFVDSKDISAQLVKVLKGGEFARRWSGTKLIVTPYHGDVARMHRRLYEMMMSHFVQAGQLHVIVATSALEAGVNIKGIDVVVVLSAARCSRASLLQRIGRAGREEGKPAVCIIGTARDDEDAVEQRDGPAGEEEEDEDAGGEVRQDDLLREPRRYLGTLNDAPRVAQTRAMQLSSARQFMRNASALGITERVGVLDALRHLAGDVDGIGRTSLSWTDRQNLLTHALGKEITVRRADVRSEPGAEVTMRGLGGQRAVSVWECFRDPPHPPWKRKRRGGGHRAYVELARIEASQCFRKLHWHSHYQTPHGYLVRVVEVFMKHRAAPATEGRWLEELQGVGVIRLQPPHDLAWQLMTRGETETHVGFDEGRMVNEATTGREVPQSVRAGTVTITVKWLGFTYRSPYRPTAVVGDPQRPEHCDDWVVPYHVGYERARARPFFQPATSDASGWRWRVTLPQWLHESAERDGAHAILCAELQLRAADALGCNARQLTFELAPWDIDDRMRDATVSREEHVRRAWAHGADARLLAYESAATGLAMQCLRVMRHTLMDGARHWKLSEPGRVQELWDSEVRELWQNAEVKNVAADALRWLLDQWNRELRQLHPQAA
ncbi:hypothetical protein AB1Y20_014394 [Prymnesium parvum]|uniref:Ubiquitinyl hydrolase 1 n=1 Tax=Prymnesium parvum TaxID=97485 RepID=A0AB34IG83_PRYPA